METKVFQFSEEQFDRLLGDRQEMVDREKRALELAESLKRERDQFALGLVHFDKQEVASLLHCSTKQLERYEKDRKLVPTRMFGKPVYSYSQLMEFIQAHRLEEVDATAMLNKVASSFPTRHRKTA